MAASLCALTQAACTDGLRDPTQSAQEVSSRRLDIFSGKEYAFSLFAGL